MDEDDADYFYDLYVLYNMRKPIYNTLGQNNFMEVILLFLFKSKLVEKMCMS